MTSVIAATSVAARVATCVAFLLLTGCLSPQALVKGDAPSAELAFDLQSQSTGGGLGKHWHVWKYEDAACEAKEKGVLVARKRLKQPMAPIRLPADRPVTLAFWYIEANFGQNRECTYTWTFTPNAGEKYSVDLRVSPYVSCDVRLTGASGVPVPATTPVNSCVTGLLGRKIENGHPAVVEYRVQTVYY
ncbi:hypothetical protein [Lysobacter silvisoli]|uniref:Lipoprotein n=1 Tax=Lysobacter silvisoli TaxID=2293254 RepID=A0A371JWZ2_9GAMM|nr:hypothetical protein [Lysobacter silvisoli]RDZ26170.1 hypothetical protein DX914_18020 [Lysobacter silvisoli]